MVGKTNFIVIFIAAVSAWCYGQRGHTVLDVEEPWKLGTQAWSFNRYTFYEAVEKTAALGLSYIEAFPGQPLAKNRPEIGNFHHDMSAAAREEVKARLAQAGVKLVNYGVVGLANDEGQCRRVFDFAREMGIETIVSEPEPAAFDIIDRLCREYSINVAIHNHPRPSRYWNPQTVLEACRGRSSYIGACADTGHWMRSGIDPVEALRKLQGRIISLHFKDIDQGHDVVWGTGQCGVGAMLTELARQDFRGVFSIEYEYNWANSMPDIAGCIDYFDEVALSLDRARWQWLFNGQDLAGWQAEPGSWVVAPGGVLYPKGGGDLWTAKRFGNFTLELEFKLAEGTNSGVFLRCGSIENWLHTAIEVQVLDSWGKKDVGKHDCGAIFDCLAPSQNAVRKPGEWNRYSITCRDNKIYVTLNAERIIDMDLNRWTESHKNPDGTANKFNTAYKDMPREGYIGLQYHGRPVWYRNIRIRQLQ